ncbi:hypothetical protein [Amycolatopsis suaedae]|uniref:Uncharacterized protein n=1 Tax=Amycolatopsis suaedae TaxID=2510978 RepID=A0A4Q7J8N2_9PSEU|nr:hypothetical protein [Amycolatopsis suaedae]RZQ63212.1 hypothetical protein EWH70_16195 [Amycolatopsis suaedae]
MLYIVLLLLLVALGLLVTALITANSLWAWISIGLSVVAGVALLVENYRRRKRRAAAAEEPEKAEKAVEDDSADEAAEDTAGRVEGELPVEDEDKPGESQTTLLPASGELDGDDAGEKAEPPADEGDPGEEDTDASDLLVISELDVEVLVVDEYPRYHLAGCAWLADRDTIPIAVAEARDLGFTPCARCGPDATLATRHRDKSGRKRKAGK